jgi:hypothetical protein
MTWKWLTVTVRVPVALLVLVLIMGAGSLLASGLQNQSFQAGQRHEEAVQRRQGQMIEHKICQDVTTMAAILPPAGPPAVNPSRAYEQAEHRAWSGLVLAIGCK